MRALVTALIYFGSFLALGTIAKLVIGRWTARRDLDLLDIRRKPGQIAETQGVFVGLLAR
jgi:hypothetical protein